MKDFVIIVITVNIKQKKQEPLRDISAQSMRKIVINVNIKEKQT